jgi:hypothetical protein
MIWWLVRPAATCWRMMRRMSAASPAFDSSTLSPWQTTQRRLPAMASARASCPGVNVGVSVGVAASAGAATRTSASAVARRRIRRIS